MLKFCKFNYTSLNMVKVHCTQILRFLYFLSACEAESSELSELKAVWVRPVGGLVIILKAFMGMFFVDVK